MKFFKQKKKLGKPRNFLLYYSSHKYISIKSAINTIHVSLFIIVCVIYLLLSNAYSLNLVSYPLVNTLHYTTLHYITLHYTTLHYITLHYTTLHYITLHYTTLHYITLHYTTLHYITLHYTTLHYITLHYTTLHYITLHYTTLHYITLHYTIYSHEGIFIIT